MNTDIKKIKKDEYNCEECVTVPAVDIYETDNEYVIKTEMPGVTKEGINITLNNGELTLDGKIEENLQTEENLKYSEFNAYNYHRKFMVGDGIDYNKLSASLENGLLTITLPKSERVKPKKIEVKVEH